MASSLARRVFVAAIAIPLTLAMVFGFGIAWNLAQRRGRSA